MRRTPSSLSSAMSIMRAAPPLTLPVVPDVDVPTRPSAVPGPQAQPCRDHKPAANRQR